jgi:hypothetical protein
VTKIDFNEEQLSRLIQIKAEFRSRAPGTYKQMAASFNTNSAKSVKLIRGLIEQQYPDIKAIFQQNPEGVVTVLLTN